MTTTDREIFEGLKRVAAKHPETRKVLVPALKRLASKTAGAPKMASANRTAHLGMDILNSLVDRRALGKVSSILYKSGDKQSFDLIRDIQEEILSRFNVSDSTERAINRLATVARDGARWDPALIRNNVFKVANELGMKLPSMMFASERAAARGWTPPSRLTKGLAKQVAKYVDKHWITDLKTLSDVRRAIAKAIISPMQMADRIDNQKAVTAWVETIPADDLRNMVRWVYENNFKGRRVEMAPSEDFLKGLR